MTYIYDLIGFLPPGPDTKRRLETRNQEYSRPEDVGTEKESLVNHKGVKETLVVLADVGALKNEGVQHQEAGRMIMDYTNQKAGDV